MSIIFLYLDGRVFFFFQGMKRVFEDMPDICLDVPAAYTLLEHLGNKMYTVGILTEEIYKELPARYVLS